MEMKQYKLIKEYPSLPPNWEIGMIVQLKNLHYLPIKLFYDDKVISYIEVENYPEFWKLVKEYEILSLIYNNDIYELSKQKRENGDYKYLSKTRRGFLALSDLDQAEDVYIHSIKRLSDNEIFTIRDKVSHLDIIWNIKEFSLKDSRCFTGGVNIYNIKKANSLFITEDNVEIFEGDTYYTVFKKMVTKHAINKIEKANPLKEDEEWSTDCLFFSTKEKAEEYIIMNKPCLSIEEIRFLDPNKYDLEKLRNLVKSKT